MRIRIHAAIVAMVLCAGSALAVAATLPAEGQPGFSISDYKLNTAQDLFDVCTIETSDANYAVAEAFCYGFFSGGKHYHDEVATVTPIGPLVCPDRQPTRDEAVAVFVAYLKRNPQRTGDRPMNVVFEAIGERWPCAAAK